MAEYTYHSSLVMATTAIVSQFRRESRSNANLFVKKTVQLNGPLIAAGKVEFQDDTSCTAVPRIFSSPPTIALKGQNNIAQGNALGKGAKHTLLSPGRAT